MKIVNGLLFSQKNSIIMFDSILYMPLLPFYGMGSTVSMLQSHYEVAVYFLPLSPQEILVLI